MAPSPSRRSVFRVRTGGPDCPREIAAAGRRVAGRIVLGFPVKQVRRKRVVAYGWWREVALLLAQRHQQRIYTGLGRPSHAHSPTVRLTLPVRPPDSDGGKSKKLPISAATVGCARSRAKSSS
jgi:hypothetical protein